MKIREKLFVCRRIRCEVEIDCKSSKKSCKL